MATKAALKASRATWKARAALSIKLCMRGLVLSDDVYGSILALERAATRMGEQRERDRALKAGRR